MSRANNEGKVIIEMSTLIKLCNTDDVQEDEPFAVHPEGLPAIAVFIVDGEYYVTDDLCTHGNALLTEGYQEGEIIECPFHDGSFNCKTGEATALPCVKPLKTYPAIVKDGAIWIDYSSE